METNNINPDTTGVNNVNFTPIKHITKQSTPIGGESTSKVFDSYRWLEQKSKLNSRTQEVIDTIFKEINRLEGKGILDIRLWTGINLTIRLNIANKSDFLKLRRKVFSQIRWFFPKEGIDITQDEDDSEVIRLKLTNPYYYNAIIINNQLNHN